MNWQAGIAGMFVAITIACGLVVLGGTVTRALRKAPRNRRTGLPAPQPDERSSIEQFKRIHNV